LKRSLLLAASALLLLAPGTGVAATHSVPLPRAGVYEGFAHNHKKVSFRVQGYTISHIEVNGGGVVPGTLTIGADGHFSYVTPKRNFEFAGRVDSHEGFSGFYTPVSFDLLCPYHAFWVRH
jgi:hypothetical protein